jgi:UDP-glucuronate 4-epimerase
MALFLFTRAILEGQPIDVFNFGKMRRDFTYVDDIVEGVVRVMDRSAESDPAFDPGEPDPALSSAPYRLFNIGNQSPVELMAYISSHRRGIGEKGGEEFSADAGRRRARYSCRYRRSHPVGRFRTLNTGPRGRQAFVEWYRNTTAYENLMKAFAICDIQRRMPRYTW